MDGKRVFDPMAWAATWSTEIPTSTSALVERFGQTPVRYVALARA
jgi:hypothetical protein